ncbi:hypothetical protein ACFLTR_04380 [Chloroflexota bacterium]
MKKERVFTKEELKEMGTPTWEAAITAVEAGDKEKAKGLIKRMRDECQRLIDSLVSTEATLMDYIYVHDGVEALEEALRKHFEGRVEAQIESLKKTDFRSLVQSRASAIRGHLQKITVEEDDEKVCFKMYPCGTGQRLLESGAYEPPRNLSKMKPHRLT